MENKSRWQQYKEKNGGVTVFDLVNPNSPKLDSTDSKKRLEICESCDRYIGVTRQCRECGCIMPMKVKLTHAKCPLAKW